MAKKSIGGIDEQVKSDFDAAQNELEVGSASEALARLLEIYKSNSASSRLDGYEAEGVSEVRQLLSRVGDQMAFMLVRRHDQESERVTEMNDEIAGQAAKIAELEDAVAKRDASIAERDVKIEELQAKADGIDRLTVAMETAQEAAAQREQDAAARFAELKAVLDGMNKQVKSYEKLAKSAETKSKKLEKQLAVAHAEIDKLRSVEPGE